MLSYKIRGLTSLLAFLYCPAICYASPPPDVQELIQERQEVMSKCYDDNYEKSSPSCIGGNNLENQIEQMGWCVRIKMKHEQDDSYVKCDTTKFASLHLDIKGVEDRPETSSLEAVWLLSLNEDDETDVAASGKLSFLSFNCDKEFGARTMVSVADNSSGITGLPFQSEFFINHTAQATDAIILPKQSNRTTVVFGSAATLDILDWVHDSISGNSTVSFLGREIASERQIFFLLSNHTSQWSEDGPTAKRWAAHMHSMCESFVGRASR